MFTGLVEGTGTVDNLSVRGSEAILTINAPLLTDGTRIGDSISINGACLTVVEMHPPWFSFDVSGETLSSTNLGQLKRGDRINVEQALRLSDRLGGHLVTGHVDGVGRLVRKEPAESSTVLSIQTPENLAPYMVEKGSVALDGISLTINRCRGFIFEVNIIPHTLERTTLNDKKMGDTFNIETDLIGKYVARFLAAQQERDSGKKREELTLSFLEQHGFLRP
jgi:riboflavin synthase